MASYTAPIKKKYPVKKKVVTSGSFPIVAIGASSGGLEAVTELFKYLPADTGMAFIFIQHLSAAHKSILVSLLSASTKMKVQEIETMELMKANNVYVIPYNKGIEVTDGHIRLTPRPKNVAPITIDVLFTSLALTHKEDAIGIVLSGNATDGTIGLGAIKREGGITFAQDNSARYGSMPQSAINEGVADFVLSPKGIASELTHISKHSAERRYSMKGGNENSIADNDPELKIVFQMLHTQAGVDFGQYKTGTIKRRILRRMFLYKLKTVKQYVRLLKEKPVEVDVLYSDLLIHVTDFFRDADAFQYLKTIVLPKLIKNKTSEERLRIWVTACSTGQEAFSIAMLLVEVMGDKFSGKQVQIFASDLSEQAIKKARTGEYSLHELKGVSPKRLLQFFTKIDDTNYRIDKTVRDMCAFSPHNILSDPPFSRIDLVTCCNLLIYLDVAMQKKVLNTFHYALNNGGYLLLGKAETIGPSQLFTQANSKSKIYIRKNGVRSLPDLPFRSVHTGMARKEILPPKKILDADPATTEKAISDILFERYIPACVVINQAMEILQFKGATANYLEHNTGKATFNILNMARPEIAFALRDAISKTIATKHESHKDAIEIKNKAGWHKIALDVIPLAVKGDEPLYLVVFTEQEQVEWQENGKYTGKGVSLQAGITIKKLKDELAFARTEVVIVSGEKEKANMILQTASEEISTSNEELQSMNEELETSKEETESANEELITTNHELQMLNIQLAEANDLSEAIVTTLHEPMVILDKDLRVRSCNKAFCKKFLVLRSETEGKLLTELGDQQWDIPALSKLLENIIDKNDHFYDYEITHLFPEIGKKTMLLNARRIVQKGQNEQLILLAFTDATKQTRERKEEKESLEDIITERTRELALSVETLRQKNISLEKMNKELETFTFISSHDLQEPLRKIKNFVGLIRREQNGLSSNGKDHLNRLEETSKRMQLLIEDLLAYSRVQNDAHHFEKTDLNKIANEVAADHEVALKQKKAIIKIGALCNVNVIRLQLRQLLNNLIGNSIKFANVKRPLRIDINSKISPGSDLNNSDLLPNVNYCHLRITDNGIGFDPKYKERIFEVFQRLHEYDEYKGTGIGLAICKRIVEKHSGFITATGVLGKGARFDIYLPVG